MSSRDVEKSQKKSYVQKKTQDPLKLFQFSGIYKSLRRAELESREIHAAQIRNKWSCRTSCTTSDRRNFVSIGSVWTARALVGRSHAAILLSPKSAGPTGGWPDASWTTVHDGPTIPFRTWINVYPNLIKRPRSTASVRHKSLFLENSFGFALNAGGSWTADLWIRKLCKQFHHLKIVQKSFKLNRSENSPRETMNLYSHANRERSCKWTNRYPPLSTWLEATPRWNFRKFLLRKKTKPETQIQMAKHDKISGAFWEITYVGIMLLREQDSTLQRTIFWCSCIALMSRDKRKRALMYFMRLPSMISGTSQRQGENFLYLWRPSTRHCRRSQDAGSATIQQMIHHVRPWSAHLRIEEYSKVSWTLCRITKNRKKARDYLGCARKLNSGTIVERNLEDEQYHMRMYE